MNNAIYRSGNLQNIISIDPLTVQTAEIIFGPGAVIYGSDAIGAVMDFHSLEPRFFNTRKTMLKGNALIRYSSANNENTFHIDFNFVKTKWSFISSQIILNPLLKYISSTHATWMTKQAILLHGGNGILGDTLVSLAYIMSFTL